jgi:amino acid transporter
MSRALSERSPLITAETTTGAPAPAAAAVRRTAMITSPIVPSDSSLRSIHMVPSRMDDPALEQSAAAAPTAARQSKAGGKNARGYGGVAAGGGGDDDDDTPQLIGAMRFANAREGAINKAVSDAGAPSTPSAASSSSPGNGNGNNEEEDGQQNFAEDEFFHTVDRNGNIRESIGGTGTRASRRSRGTRASVTSSRAGAGGGGVGGAGEENTAAVDDSNNANGVAEPEKPVAPLGAIALFGLLFSFSCGGGYGFEDAVGAAKPLPLTLFVLFVPWIWCLPTALAVSELATMAPSNAGFLLWSDMSLPKQVTMFNVISTIVCSFIANSAYPSLFAQYVNSYFYSEPVISGGVDVTAIPSKVIIMLLSTVLNVIGVDIVGGFAMFLSAMVTLPFIIMFIIQSASPLWLHDAVVSEDGSVITTPSAHNFTNNASTLWNVNVTSNVTDGVAVQPGLDWTTIIFANDWQLSWPRFLSIGSWNYAGYEAAGQVIEEVDNPQKTMMRAFIPLMISTYLAYLLPVWAGVSVFKAGPKQDWGKWHAGYWPTVAGYVAQGKWMVQYLRAGAVATSVGYCISSLGVNARVIAGIGQIGALPKVASEFIATYHPRFKTPVNAILIMSGGSILLSVLVSFERIVAITQSLYMFRMLTIYWALIYMRRHFPNLHRPYKVPLSDKWLTALMVPPTVFCVAVMIMAVLGDTMTEVATAGFVVFSAVVAVVAVKLQCFGGVQEAARGQVAGVGGAEAYLPRGITSASAAGKDSDREEEDDTNADANDAANGTSAVAPAKQDHHQEGAAALPRNRSATEVIEAEHEDLHLRRKAVPPPPTTTEAGAL